MISPFIKDEDRQRCIQLMVRDPSDIRQVRVLLVDDDLHSQEKIRQALEGVFIVQCATSLVEANAYIAAQPPDILISEAFLGCESGLDLCRSIRVMPSLRHLPIMIVTTHATLEDKVAGFDAGADDYVVKPFDAPHLAARIRLLLRIKHLEQRENE
ncbi:MAG: response regulator [Ktedonobacteraceae bacterium]|nr:response regulator [Ktedonobacteraceae bacterium]